MSQEIQDASAIEDATITSHKQNAVTQQMVYFTFYFLGCRKLYKKKFRKIRIKLELVFVKMEIGNVEI